MNILTSSPIVVLLISTISTLASLVKKYSSSCPPVQNNCQCKTIAKKITTQSWTWPNSRTITHLQQLSPTQHKAINIYYTPFDSPSQKTPTSHFPPKNSTFLPTYTPITPPFPSDLNIQTATAAPAISNLTWCWNWGSRKDPCKKTFSKLLANYGSTSPPGMYLLRHLLPSLQPWHCGRVLIVTSHSSNTTPYTKPRKI